MAREPDGAIHGLRDNRLADARAAHVWIDKYVGRIVMAVPMAITVSAIRPRGYAAEYWLINRSGSA